jgi:hypothetical protein
LSEPCIESEGKPSHSAKRATKDVESASADGIKIQQCVI